MAEVPGNLRQKAVASLAAGILRGAGYLPGRWRAILGAMLGDLVRLGMTRARNVVDANLTIAFPRMGLTQRHTLRRAHFRALGQATLELGPLWYWPLPRALGLIREVRGDDLVDAALAKGRGVILFTAHLGAWEAAVLYIGQRWPVTVPYMETRNPAVNARIMAGRGRSGAQLVPKEGGIRPLLQALHKETLSVYFQIRTSIRAKGIMPLSLAVLPAQHLCWAGWQRGVEARCSDSLPIGYRTVRVFASRLCLCLNLSRAAMRRRMPRR